MRMLKLKLHNFMLFRGDHELVFPSEGLIFIRGMYDGNPASSNRAGKSSLLRSILYCAYGDSGSRQETQLVHTGASEMWVEMEILCSDGTLLTVRRGRTDKNVALFEVNNLQEREEKEDAVRRGLGLSCDDFVHTCYVRQKELTSFILQDNAQKKESLRRWLGISYWDEPAKYARVEIGKLEAKLQALTTSIGDHKARIGNVSVLSVDERIRMTRMLEAKEADLESQKVQRDQVTEEVALLYEVLRRATDVSDLDGRIGDLQSRVQAVETRGKGCVDGKVEAAGRQTRITGLKEEIAVLERSVLDGAGLRNRVAGLTSQIGSLGASLSAKQVLATKLETFTGECPIDCGPCPRDMRGAAGPVRQEAMKIAETKKTVASDLAKAMSGLEVMTTTATKVQRLSVEVANLSSKPTVADVEATIEDVLRTRRSLLSALEGLTKQKELSAETLSDMARARDRIGVAQQLKVSLDDAIRAAEFSVSGIKKDLTIDDERGRLREDLGNSLQVLELQVDVMRQDHRQWQFVAAMLGKDGIPSIQTENAFAEIEADSNFVLAEVGLPIRIGFLATRETTQDETVCYVCGEAFAPRVKVCQSCQIGVRRKKRRDEMTIPVYEGTKTTDFSLDSGGGQDLIALAIRVALSRLLQRRSGTTCQLLCLDEIFGSLDRVRRAELLRTMMTFLSKQWSQILFTTHTDLGGEFSGNVLRVTRYPEYSTLAWEDS